MPEPVIKLRDVTKTYQMGEFDIHALNGVTLTIERGEFTVIAGPSGSGKTTLLNIISGLDTVTSGSVELASQSLGSMSGRALSDFRRDHLGFIFQAYNLLPVLTVKENIEYIMVLQSVAPRERSARVAAILRDVGLEGYEQRFPLQLSGGQQQRVAVARAMVSGPDIIMADEPTANLDSAAAISLLKMMRALNEQSGVTFIFSTHDEKIMKMARRLILLADGAVDRDERRD